MLFQWKERDYATGKNAVAVFRAPEGENPGALWEQGWQKLGWREGEP